MIAEPLRWVLLATAFHACLVLYAARVDEEVATEPGDGVSTPRPAKARPVKARRAQARPASSARR
ncbi:MAG: hypothetical protein R2742_05560 [Micropruina glycogenica]